MALMHIESIYAENNGKPPPADVNTAHVVAAHPSKLHAGCTEIELNARDGKGGAVRKIVTPLSFETVLTKVGPFVSVELQRIHDGTPCDYHVRPDAIAAVRHLPADGGRVWLVNDEDLYVTDTAMQSLATLIEAETIPG